MSALEIGAIEDRRDVSRFSLGHGALQPIAAIMEGAALVCAGGVATLVYQRLVSPGEALFSFDFFGVALATSLLFVTMGYLKGSYDPATHENRRASIVAALKTWGLTLAFMALSAFLFKVGASFSRATMLFYAGFGALAIAATRAAWPAIVHRAVEGNLVFVTNVLVVRIGEGADRGAAADGSLLSELRDGGLRPIGWRSVSTDGPALDGRGLDGQGDGMASVIAFVDAQFRLGRLNEVVLLADHTSLSHLDSVVERLRVVPIPVRFILDPLTRAVIDRSLKRVGSLVLAEYQRAPFSAAERCLKRALDVVVSLAGMIVLSPLFMLTALAVRLDSPGPVLFRQSRRGFGGKTFMILKFRSMTAADSGLVVVQARRDDVRVTPVGRWLRCLSIDELPQLWNVLRGEMSIVGPRPHAVAHDDYYSRLIEEYAFRRHAKPGLTGWAQVKGLRGETPLMENMKARIEKDVWYINNWSIWLDIAIIIRTSIVVLGQRMAY